MNVRERELTMAQGAATWNDGEPICVKSVIATYSNLYIHRQDGNGRKTPQGGQTTFYSLALTNGCAY